jgi:hypothetical protein
MESAMLRQLENVRQQLLCAGIAPRHASRYITELREHLTDLTAQERASGLDARQADERALVLLGSEAQLAQAMIDKGAPRSLAARAPWAVFAVLPVVLALVVIWVTAILMMNLLWPVRGLAPSAMPNGYITLITSVSFFTNYLVGPLLATGCIVIALRQRLASRWVWVGLCLIAMVSGPLGFHMHFNPSEIGGQGSASFSAWGFVYRQERADLSATLSVTALRTAVLFAMAAIAYGALRKRFMSVRARVP